MRKILPLGLIALFAAPHTGFAQDQSTVQAGIEIYNMHCAECHGERLINTGSAFDLRTLMPDERPRFDKSVMDGKGQMPAWQGTLSKDDLDKIWAYIRSRADN